VHRYLVGIIGKADASKVENSARRGRAGYTDARRRNLNFIAAVEVAVTAARE